MLRRFALLIGALSLLGCYASHRGGPDRDASARADADLMRGPDAGPMETPDAGPTETPDAGPPPLCAEDLGAEVERLRAVVSALGFASPPPPDTVGVVEEVSARELTLRAEDGSAYRFRWVEEHPLDGCFSAGERLEAILTDDWQVLRGDRFTVGLALMDRAARPAPRRLSELGVPDSDTVVGFGPACRGSLERDGCATEGSLERAAVELYGATTWLDAGEAGTFGSLTTIGLDSAVSVGSECGAPQYVGVAYLVNEWFCIC